MNKSKLIHIIADEQQMDCYLDDKLYKSYSVSTGKKGLGERYGSECTPQGWHRIHDIIGLQHAENSVFVGRQWTGEIYTPELALQFPNRDWILTRILQLDGLEPLKNKGGDVDSLARYIYIHGTPDTTPMGIPGSHGCIRMRNADLMELADWVCVDLRVCIYSTRTKAL
jgi:lipoprotein-anchoring transpeptidase ErfK/SrfK